MSPPGRPVFPDPTPGHSLPPSGLRLLQHLTVRPRVSAFQSVLSTKVFSLSLIAAVAARGHTVGSLIMVMMNKSPRKGRICLGLKVAVVLVSNHKGSQRSGWPQELGASLNPVCPSFWLTRVISPGPLAPESPRIVLLISTQHLCGL